MNEILRNSYFVIGFLLTCLVIYMDDTGKTRNAKAFIIFTVFWLPILIYNRKNKF